MLPIFRSSACRKSVQWRAIPFWPRIEVAALSKRYAARIGGTNLVSIWLEIVPEALAKVSGLGTYGKGWPR
ncbi:hypothetical protein [Bradyrhizobium sp. CCBAU 51753]|uniref:hypothetical protein n=1 Tax=Bradyrhizobium sp. CCBAU 51753 TaxID=1325100 RepID=UPI00188D17E3|nr:hypothetical protein [Bradyrhizobium sp. CCBAU 51753]